MLLVKVIDQRYRNGLRPILVWLRLNDMDILYTI